MNENVISVDFDGVLHKYSKGWLDGTCYDEPVDNSVESVERLIKAGYRVYILTAREDLDAIREWLAKHNFPELEVSNKKIPARAYIDDRGLRFNNDWISIRKYFT